MKTITAKLFFTFLLLMAQTGYAVDKDFDCSRSFCGCSSEVEITYKTTIVSADLVPQPDIKVSCPQKGVLGVSDESGNVAFTFKTTQSPGCGLVCGVLTFSRETSAGYEAWNIRISPLKTERTILGQYYQKGERRNNRNDGIWKEWCSSTQWGFSGRLRVSGNYKEGLKDGEWTEWYCEGGIKSKGNYRHDKKEGTWTEWYGNGRIHQQIDWHDDKMNGKWLSWYPDGQIEAEMEMRDNKRTGNSTYYTKEGKKYFTDPSGRIVQDPDLAE